MKQKKFNDIFEIAVLSILYTIPFVLIVVGICSLLKLDNRIIGLILIFSGTYYLYGQAVSRLIAKRFKNKK